MSPFPVTSSRPAAPPRPRLCRAGGDRVVAGVARGVADHLGVDVWIVRGVFVFLAFSNLAGVVAYAALWILMPQAEDDAATAAGLDAEATISARRRTERLGPLLLFGLVAGLTALFAERLGLGLGGLTLPVVVVGVGVAVLWRVADDAQRERWRAAATATAADSGRSWVRLAGGLALVAVGVGGLLLAQGGFGAAVEGLAAIAVVLTGAALVTGPWLYRLAREARTERAERIRSQERAELAAHVHDSVLQTLTLVQRHAHDPKEIVRLARAEERALRGWLYDPGSTAADTFRPELERLVADVESRHGGTIDAVVVGDAPLDPRLQAALQATREAAVNAVKYAGDAGPVSVYAEVSDREVAVFVRDRGPGFDLDAVPADRHGVRESIVGRMERHGGRAVVRARPGAGTEVELTMPREQW